MTADIVERLRTRYKLRCRRCDRFNVDTGDLHALLDQAADEIERLRTENAELQSRLDTVADKVIDMLRKRL